MALPKPILIDIGTHSLALYTHGPEPSSSEHPVVLFVSGVACSSLIWSAVVRQLAPSIRSYTYDRSGYSNSELSPVAPTAENIALELSHLIKRASISNPLILVGHSWAGVLISEFIARMDSAQQIAGLVLVDANHETAPLVLNVNDPILVEVLYSVEPYAAMGLEAEHKLTQEEWSAYKSEHMTEKYLTIAQQEDSEYAPSFETLRKKEQSKRQPLLGNKPVYVIGGKRSQDWSRMYQAAVARGKGTEEQRSHIEEMIRTADEKNEGLMKEFLKFSTVGKVVFAIKSGHFVPLTEPDMVVNGVEWVIDNMKVKQ